MKTLVTGCD